MTKLEEKLIELGYIKSIFQSRYIKYYKQTYIYSLIQLSINNDEIRWHTLDCNSSFDEQQDIDNLQQAFNEMQKDLKVCKEYEN